MGMDGERRVGKGGWGKEDGERRKGKGGWGKKNGERRKGKGEWEKDGKRIGKEGRKEEKKKRRKRRGKGGEKKGKRRKRRMGRVGKKTYPTSFHPKSSATMKRICGCFPTTLPTTSHKSAPKSTFTTILIRVLEERRREKREE
jgi:hypothetical protein